MGHNIFKTESLDFEVEKVVLWNFSEKGWRWVAEGGFFFENKKNQRYLIRDGMNVA